MANEEQLSILKQGVKVWNEWLTDHREVEINLTGVDLSGTDLSRVNLSRANLFRANLSGANLSTANLYESNLSWVDLSQAVLSEAFLSGANLTGALLVNASLGRTSPTRTFLHNIDFIFPNVVKAGLGAARLEKACLIRADLGGANLEGVGLVEADLSEAALIGVNLNEANLLRSIWGQADIGNTIFANSDLSKTMVLDQVIHHGPSVISTNTLTLSTGKIPEAFLKGCGLSDWEIEQAKLYNPDLDNDEITQIQYRIYELRATQAVQISPLFISYSREDNTLVDKVGEHLNKKGIRYWRDIHEMKAGRIEKQIDRAIRQNPTVLLILSENSLSSDWVEHEVRTARQLEKDMERDVLCPIALDDSWKSSRWPKRIMEQVMKYNILDFSAWEDDVKFDSMFRKLIDGLELFYKG